MSAPEVSIILPTFNRARLLPRALDSIIAQTFQDWQIVLVDDGSVDETASVAARYAERLRDRSQRGWPLIYIRQPNGGSSSARNRGIDACSGRFVVFLDSDDEFLPARLQRQLDLFSLRPELGFVYSDYAYIDLEGRREGSAFDTVARRARAVPHEVVAPGLCVCTDDLFDALIREYFVATIVGMVRREILADAIRFPLGHAYAEEWLFYLRVARACRAGFVDEPLCLHHHTSGSLARTDRRRNNLRYYGLVRAIDEAFDDLPRDQRKAVRRNAARACRQLGYDAAHGGDHREAFRRFAESLRYERRFDSARAALQEAFRCLRPGSPGDSPGQRAATRGCGEVSR